MENRYGLYLSRDGTTLRFPVNPESYKISRDSDNGTYNVLGVGPIMVPRTPKLQVITWSGLLPGRPEGGVVTAGRFQPPEFYIRFLQAAMDERTAVRFVANGGNVERGHWAAVCCLEGLAGLGVGFRRVQSVPVPWRVCFQRPPGGGVLLRVAEEKGGRTDEG